MGRPLGGAIVRRFLPVPLVLGAGAASAVASSVEVDTRTCEDVGCGGDSATIYFRAEGDRARLTVSRRPEDPDAPSSPVFDVEDLRGRLTPGSGCRRVDEHHATCEGEYYNEIFIRLGPGKDRATLDSSLATSSSRFNRSEIDVYGEGGLDRLFGGAATESVDGGAGNDIIQGAGGHDTLNGNAGADTLDGGRGADTLTGGPGRDDLNCGAGRDLAVAARADKVSRTCERVRRSS